ncbi:MAG: hypothetical protein ACE15B_10395 [Bryobacteraceae bacterium]
MKPAAVRLFKALGVGCALVVAAGLLAPRIGADRFGPRIQAALERAFGRKVEIGRVRFELFTGPGFSIDRVTIHEDPAFGLEPVAYVGALQAVPRLHSLFARKLEFASIRLTDASINIAKSGAASEPGRWNFEPLLHRSLMTAFPEIHVRSGRVNFKFGDRKSVFYLTGTDFDIYPPVRGDAWNIRISGAPARTDRSAHGFGAFRARGGWRTSDRLDLDLELEPSAVGEMITLVHGQSEGIHGNVSARLRLTGPLRDIRLTGRILVEDVHRWDVLPPKGHGWPLRVAGRLDIPGQSLEVESSSPAGEALPLSVRFRVADYLGKPRWAVAANWNRFPLQPLVELARHMGIAIPPRLALTGNLDGAVGYDGSAGMQGELSFHDAALTIPDSPPVRFEQARLLFAGAEARLTPALVRAANNDQAEIEAVWRWARNELELTVSTESMHVASLRSQVALAAVPWLGQAASGVWSGRLHYKNSGAGAGWDGQIELRDAGFPIAGIPEPLLIRSVRARIQGARLSLDRLRARAGKTVFEGEYRYEPAAPRPHRLRLHATELDGAELERLLAPTLYRRRGLIARALNLGRPPVPDWLRTRRMEGSVEAGSLALGPVKLENLRARLLWDGTRARLERFTARTREGTLSGVLNMNLRGSEPAYLFAGKLKDAACRSGSLDAEGVLETRGAGAALLANLQSRGWFEARSLDLGVQPAFDSISGNYSLAWAVPEPRLAFTGLRLTSGAEVYAGQGATQEDGRMLFLLTSSGREMHVSGTLSKLKVEEPAAP